MNVVESDLVANAARDALLPHGTPVTRIRGIQLRMRNDPFTGELAITPASISRPPSARRFSPPPAE